MQFANPFKQKGLWLKGNTHTHTRASDGALTATEIGQAYGRRDYDFVFLTDHWKRTVPPSGLPQKPLLIPAQELDFTVEGNIYHVVCLGLRSEWKGKGLLTSWKALGRKAQNENAVLILAHPYWSGTRSEQLLAAAPVFLGAEVYNTVCDMGIAKGYSGAHWDDLLDAGHQLAGFAVDDTHGAANIGRGWIMVKAKTCTAGAVMNAIRRGCFYATQGPEIKDITVRGRKIEITCSPARRINFICNRYNGCTLGTTGRLLTTAAWEVYKGPTYVRVEIVDRQGRTAWSNPVFF